MSGSTGYKMPTRFVLGTAARAISERAGHFVTAARKFATPNPNPRQAWSARLSAIKAIIRAIWKHHVKHNGASVIRIASIIVNCVGSIALLAILVVSLWGVRAVFNDNPGFFNVLLTLALVVVTSIYVYYTYQLVFYQKEVQLAELRPIFYVTVDRDKGHQDRHMVNIVVRNIGKGPALNLHAQSVYAECAGDHFEPMTHSHFTKDRADAFLDAGQETLRSLDVSDAIASLRKTEGKFDDFLSIELVYEDPLRTLYHYKQEYSVWLRVSDEDISWTLALDAEYLWRTLANKRQMRDMDFRIGMGGRRGLGRPIFSRRYHDF